MGYDFGNLRSAIGFFRMNGFKAKKKSPKIYAITPSVLPGGYPRDVWESSSVKDVPMSIGSLSADGRLELHNGYHYIIKIITPSSRISW